MCYKRTTADVSSVNLTESLSFGGSNPTGHANVISCTVVCQFCWFGLVTGFPSMLAQKVGITGTMEHLADTERQPFVEEEGVQ